MILSLMVLSIVLLHSRGNLFTRTLSDIVSKEDFVLDSEYLITLLVLIPHQAIFSLPQTDTITESDNQSKCRVAGPSSNTYIYKATPAPKA